jgi:hypothetical protein
MLKNLSQNAGQETPGGGMQNSLGNGLSGFGVGNGLGNGMGNVGMSDQQGNSGMPPGSGQMLGLNQGIAPIPQGAFGGGNQGAFTGGQSWS